MGLEITNLSLLFDGLGEKVQHIKTITTNSSARLVVLPISDILGYVFCLGLAVLHVIEIWNDD
jgi:hypothetical protein